MSTDNNKLSKLKKELQLVERNLELLSLKAEEERPKSPSSKQTPQERFPIDSPVRLTGPRESSSLRNKLATVTGHTAKFVKLERKGEDLRRAPSNLTPSK